MFLFYNKNRTIVHFFFKIFTQVCTKFTYKHTTNKTSSLDAIVMFLILLKAKLPSSFQFVLCFLLLIFLISAKKISKFLKLFHSQKNTTIKLAKSKSYFGPNMGTLNYILMALKFSYGIKLKRTKELKRRPIKIAII